MKIFSTAPARVSLFGGGTDVDPYASTYGGLCVNFAVNLRQNLILYSGDDLYEHPYITVPPLGQKEFYYAILEEFGVNDMHLSSIKAEFDGLIESGIGSSASAAVCLIGAIHRRLNLKMNLAEIAEKAWHIEVEKLGLFGGKQDQYVAAYGGVNVMEFKRDEVRVTPLARGFIEPILPSLLLFYTGRNRKSAKIQEGFKELTRDQIWALNRIKKLAYEAIEPVAQGDYMKVGALLDEAWEFKKLSNKGVTNKSIDAIYARAKDLGAYGGKVLGAGGGGFMLFVVNPEEREKLIKELGLEWWDFGIDWNGLEVRDITGK